MTSLAKETGCLACGVDPSYLGEEKSADGLCAFLKKAYDQELARALGEGTFDCVIMRQVFDQLPNPRVMMQTIASNLRDGGYLYVEGLEFHNLLNQRSILDLRACLKSGGMPDRRGFFRWARRFDAGILCVFQVKSTRPSGKRCAGMAF